MTNNINTLYSYEVLFRLDNRSGLSTVPVFLGEFCDGLLENCKGIHIENLVLTKNKDYSVLFEQLKDLQCTYANVLYR